MVAMDLAYLLFDFTDEESGACSFDALASVTRARVPALLAEVQAVLAWAHREFGVPAGTGEEDGEWAYALEAADEREAPLAIRYEVREARVCLDEEPQRVTLAFTLSGSGAFGAAFREAFTECG